MANHKSALKRARQSEVRRMRNRARKSRMKTAIRKLEEAIRTNAVDEAVVRLREATSIIAKTAAKGTIHRNTAARKISRLTKKVNMLKVAQSA
ncbi:30S ribosomal protein S20 [Desulfosoma caldarium]|uniref:Small ribosomal subunit protein bS20 n=1 Tax=Desulfosoma caldarium TaxID=610254 RepID=A0A3N1UTB7_9BACT|nr:30S ribosomal protein S20 [Desulfosoma caldarium]ROQ91091.1 SSU ribosomal protein S20P [Desulfosoma caldarium]